VTLNHAPFESLAAAVALGEASAEERAAFATHAAGCAECAADLSEASPLALLREAREGEDWRPSVSDAVMSRVREVRTRNSRLVFGALGYAAALSIVLNIALVTGVAGRVYDSLADAGSAVPAPVAPAGLVSQARAQPPVISLAPGEGRVPAIAALHRSVRRAQRAPIRPAAGPPDANDVPDVLAGLIQPTVIGASRDIAVESLPACADGGVQFEGAAPCQAMRAAPAR